MNKCETVLKNSFAYSVSPAVMKFIRAPAQSVANLGDFFGSTRAWFAGFEAATANRNQWRMKYKQHQTLGHVLCPFLITTTYGIV